MRRIALLVVAGARARRLRLLVPHLDDERSRRGAGGRSRARTRSSSPPRRRSPIVSPCSRTARSSSRSCRDSRATRSRSSVSVTVSSVKLEGQDNAKVDLHHQARVGAALPKQTGTAVLPERHVEGRIREPLQARRAAGPHAARLRAVSSTGVTPVPAASFAGRGPRGRLRGPLPHLPRQHDRQRRAREHPDVAQRQRPRPAVDRQRLHARVRRADAHRRDARRPVRTEEGDARRRRDLLRRRGDGRARARARASSSPAAS